MRNIKFRGKLLYIETWRYGSLFIDESQKIIMIADNESGIANEVYLETVGQYTGLKDKNGKEIYEGDIVKLGTYTKGVVEYSDKYAQFIIINTNAIEYEYEPLGDYTKIEKIGNKWDNPELLEEGE